MVTAGTSCHDGNTGWRAVRYLSLAVAVSLGHFVAPFQPTHACGWWGDGEMNRDNDPAFAPVTGASGGVLPRHEASKLPDEVGYAIAVRDPGYAVPYLEATYGRRINRIGELKSLGYEAVIDLGASPHTARLHRAETEALGMRYFNIPIEGELPNKEQVDRFGRLIVTSERHPVLVYAPTAGLLGIMWASYRIGYLGAPQSFALEEGRSLGMTREQGAALVERLR